MVLPGVGAFTDAMTTMEGTGQADALRTAVADGVPFLGICLGMHLLFDWGDEGQPEGERLAGLGVLPGHIERMAAFDATGAKHKIPHVGWNSVEFVDGPVRPEGAAAAFRSGIDDASYFYFTHSYCAVPDDQDDLVATSEHARRFAAPWRVTMSLACNSIPRSLLTWDYGCSRTLAGLLRAHKAAQN